MSGGTWLDDIRKFKEIKEKKSLEGMVEAEDSAGDNQSSKT